ncbi:hypothetical protein WJ88_08845 [Burkholderia ubonensis]|nr:hypothetical protein WJ88_08845 [Burkholderia ubonensis]
MGVNIHSFQNVAKSSIVCVQQGHDGTVTLKSGLFAGRSVLAWSKASNDQLRAANLQTAGLFLNALQREYGSEISGFLASRLDLETGRTPLSGRVISRLTREADGIRQQMAAFNSSAVSDFLHDPKGMKALLAACNRNHWSEGGAYRQLATMLHEAVQGRTVALQQAQVWEIARSVLERIDQLPATCQKHFSLLAPALESRRHEKVLAALDCFAEDIDLRAQFELGGLSHKNLGADDQMTYLSRIVAEQLLPMSPERKVGLLDTLLTDPTCKEIASLLGSPAAKMAIMDALEGAGRENDDQMKMLSSLCRTHALLDAMLSELDRQVGGRTSASPRLIQWLSCNVQGYGAGEIACCDQEFARAFVSFQKRHNGIELSHQLGVAGHERAHMTIVDLAQIRQGLEAMAAMADREGESEQFIKDFARTTYIVNGRQVSRNDVTERDDIDKVPPTARHFANQEIFADALDSLRQQYDMVFVGDPNSTFNLQIAKNGDIYLNAIQEMKPKILMYAQGGDQKLLVQESSRLHFEINLLIRKEEGAVAATLTSPISFEYRGILEQ